MSAQSSSPERLEQQAVEQRQRIHRTALELISKVDEAKQRLTPTYNVRRHFAVTALIAAGIAILSGYLLGMSSMNRR